LQTGEGNATYLRPFQDERTLLNMSVWESIESLRHFVYKTMHVELLRQRYAWFEKFAGAYAALWWVPAGHRPGIVEAKRRIAYLEANCPSQFAFIFNTVFQLDEQFQRGIDWSSFRPCIAERLRVQRKRAYAENHQSPRLNCTISDSADGIFCILLV
jgi:hypothetical protein